MFSQLRSLIIIAIISGALSTPAISAPACPFEKWMTYKGTQIHRNAAATAYLFATDRSHIDADGAPKAYHPDDVGKPCGATGPGLDCPANAGYPNRNWWPDVLARDPARPSRAYVQRTGPAKGFFVSKTALFSPGNGNELDPSRYVDAGEIPYLVFPGPFFKKAGTGLLGDVGIAYQTATRRSVAFVVGDVGPNEPLGEASIALFTALGGNNPNPRNGKGVAEGTTMYLIFPYSVKDRAQRWPLSTQDIAREAEARINELGGIELFSRCGAGG